MQKHEDIGPKTSPQDLPEMLTLAEARAFLRLSRAAAYQLVASGQLSSERFGRSIRIPRKAVLGER
jgi:excisionase family DNA binding protein